MVDMILPNTKVKPYINLVCNFIFVFMIISPLVSFFSNNMSLEDTILKKMSDYSKIKEKNSNNDNNEDIQSNDMQEEEVFRSKSELNLKESKLKEDLIKVLDISIEDIEID